MSDAEKATKFVRIAELYLEETETIDAEAYVNRAAQYIHSVKDEQLKTKFKVCYARVLDSKRKYVEASSRYYELSTITQVGDLIVDEADLNMLLKKAMISAILANAGPLKARMLEKLYKDERVRYPGLSVFFSVLEKMFFERLLKSADLIHVEEALETHQKATLSDGSTNLQRALVEHNILCVARLYHNISFVSLGELLEIDHVKAEKVVSKMIIEGRMEALIDQVKGILIFNSSESIGKASSSLGSSEVKKNVSFLKKGVHEEFDEKISQFCDDVNALTHKIIAKYPVYEKLIE